jgi:hypothetical protein
MSERLSERREAAGLAAELNAEAAGREMKRWRVSGGLAGRDDPRADQVTRTGRFEEWFDDREDAINRARAICRDLRPGGCVCVCEEERLLTDGFPSLTDGEFVSLVERRPDGSWYVSGLDLNEG